jgi:hypothetical protein
VGEQAGADRGFGAAQGDQQAAELGAVFEIDAHHFETGLLRADKTHDGLHADGAQASGNFQGGFGADWNLYVAAEETAIKAEHADCGREFSARGRDGGRHSARQTYASITAVAHEIPLGDGIEWRKSNDFSIQARLREEGLHPLRVQFH